MSTDWTRFSSIRRLDVDTEALDNDNDPYDPTEFIDDDALQKRFIAHASVIPRFEGFASGSRAGVAGAKTDRWIGQGDRGDRYKVEAGNATIGGSAVIAIGCAGSGVRWLGI